MENQAKTSQWQDWALIALRCLLLVVAAIELPTLHTSDGALYAQNEITIALVIGVLSTILLIIPIMFHALRVLLPPVVVISDWLMMGLILYISRGDMLVSVAAGSLVIVTSVLRIQAYWGSIQAIGIIIVMLLVRPEIAKLAPSQAAMLSDRLPIFILALFGAVANIWSYAIQRQIGSQEAQLLAEKTSRESQIIDMQERTRAISDMAAVLSSTLNYEKILQAAMNVGWLGLRDKKREIPEKLVSMVLLFRASDNHLHVVVSRGLTRLDEQRSTPGLDGVIGEALKQTIPIFGDSPRKDIELGNFVAFQTMRSVMCVPLRAGFTLVALRSMTQDVAAIAMRMAIIQRMLEKTPDEVPQELQKVEDLARKTTKEIRHMLFTLRPLVLENQGLEAALHQFAEKMQETHNQNVKIQVGPNAEKMLDSNQQGVIFYIIEEAVGNARKHAQADTIRVMLQQQEDVVVVQIADNGVGFDTAAVQSNYDSRGSLGMVNMRERTQLLDGSLKINSARGRGTTITVLVPIKDPSERRSVDRTARHARTKLDIKAQEQFKNEPEQSYF